MPGQTIDTPNPPALPSHLPADVDVLSVSLERKSLNPDVRSSLEKWQRTANYLAAGMYSSLTRRFVEGAYRR